MSKKTLGQFFTTNYDYILQGLNIPNNITHIIEPFCGNGDLLKFLPEKYTLECYDIDVKKDYVIYRDTLNDPPVYNNKFVLTNPPYLARNKTEEKKLFDKYEVNDLYKCFIKELLTNKCLGGIIIIPLNFWSSIRKADTELRKKFLECYNIIKLNIFEEQVFVDTSYTVCSVSFELKIKDLETKESENMEFITEIFPSKNIINAKLNEKNSYLFGGDIYNLKNSGKYKITRLTIKNKDKQNTNILVKCIDDNASSKIGLSLVKPENIYIDMTQNLSARTYATLVIEPNIDEKIQELLVSKFNTFLNQHREKYHSLSLSNYRESKDIARKRISFDLVYDICSYLLDEIDLENSMNTLSI